MVELSGMRRTEEEGAPAGLGRTRQYTRMAPAEQRGIT